MVSVLWMKPRALHMIGTKPPSHLPNLCFFPPLSQAVVSHLAWVMGTKHGSFATNSSACFLRTEVFLQSPLYFLRQYLRLKVEFTQVFSRICFHISESASAFCCTQLSSLGCGGQNSGPHAFVTSILATEPPP